MLFLSGAQTVACSNLHDMMNKDRRPPLNDTIALQEFLDFYWLKKELVQFCRDVGLPTTGTKRELEETIIAYLKTGSFQKPIPKRQRSESAFDWSEENLQLTTIITDNYKNTQNVRRFFELEIGPSFSFNVYFMNWMKANTGKTLEEAIAKWYLIKKNKKSQTRSIEPQFEYNQYVKDCRADNPGITFSEVVKLWKFKKSQRGHNKYEVSDLDQLID